jgi:hypothetical protein
MRGFHERPFDCPSGSNFRLDDHWLGNCASHLHTVFGIQEANDSGVHNWRVIRWFSGVTRNYGFTLAINSAANRAGLSKPTAELNS